MTLKKIINKVHFPIQVKLSPETLRRYNCTMYGDARIAPPTKVSDETIAAHLRLKLTIESGLYPSTNTLQGVIATLIGQGNVSNSEEILYSNDKTLNEQLV